MHAQLFYFMVKISREEGSKLWKNIFFIVFSRLDPIVQVLRQVKESLILKFHEMIRVLQEAACPVVFISFYDQGCQGVGLNVLKK